MIVLIADRWGAAQMELGSSNAQESDTGVQHRPVFGVKNEISVESVSWESIEMNV